MKNYLFLLFGILFISLVSAQSLGTFPQDFSVNLIQICDNCTSVNVTSVLFPNSSFALEGNNAMTQTGQVYNYTFSRTTTLGVYQYTTCGDLNGIQTCNSVDFTITKEGYPLSTAQATIYAVFFFVLIFFFIITIFGINMLPSSNTTDEEGKIMSISYLKYFRSVLWFFEWMFLLAIMFLASNLGYAYLGEELFASVFFNIFRIMFAVTPAVVLVWIGWILVRAYQDRQFQNILNRGLFPRQRL